MQAMTKEIARNELRSLLSNGHKPILIEALPARYYLDSHLPGAVHMPHDRTAELAGEVAPDRNRDIVVYCASATCRNSHIAAAQLERLGYANVRVYAGGKQDWVEAGLATESGGIAR
jgi:rhodanese-related sulfurtransferase